MNSRNTVNDANLVNFSTDLATLSPFDSKEPLLSFPFDHIYACHSDSPDRRQTLQLDKEVEISTHCILPEDRSLIEKLNSLENQNKKLKDLLIYHLDLIQQQNELITKKEKIFQALKLENDALKSKVTRKGPVAGGARTLASQPAIAGPSTSTGASSVYFNSLTELLLPDKRGQFILKNQGSKPKAITNIANPETFEIIRTDADPTSYIPSTDTITTILDPGPLCTDTFEMVEHKRPPAKKDNKPEVSEPRYTVTTNSGNPVIQRISRNRKKSTGIGSLSRMPKAPPKPAPEEANKIYDEDKIFGIKPASKMLGSYGKTKIGTSKYLYTGSLSDRLQLIDTTPTGEDPYQLGEAEMRAQSPIPRLMLQKSHGRMKVCTDNMSGVTSTTTSTTATKRIYDTLSERPVKAQKTSSRAKKEPPRTTSILDDPDLDLIKSEPEIDWSIYPDTNSVKDISVCDFAFDEPTADLKPEVLNMEGSDFFFMESVGADSPFGEIPLAPEPLIPEKTKKRGARSISTVGSTEDFGEPKRGTDSKRGGRKRASSTASNKRDTQKAATKPKQARGRAAANRGKKTPVPGMTTKEPYFTELGDPDLSWYLGLDPDVKKEDVEQISEPTASNVEVPRWREKHFTSLYSLEGTENLDDKVFEKRHQKLEAEERRQLRWHMRRLREQRHVEKLRQRQRDPWGPNNNQANSQPKDYTVWPQPLRDLQFIEITDTLPVSSLGEHIPALSDACFVLPWVKTSKAQKRSKRSRTLH